MAAGYLPSPGKVVSGQEIGPCVSPCKHTDCAETRRQAESHCPYCKKAIGYETAHYTVGRDDDGLVILAHAVCLESQP